MKTKAYLLAISLFLCTGVIQAQSSRSKVEDRVERVVSKFDDVLKLDKTTTASVTEIFSDFYAAQDKIRDNIQRPVSSLAQGFTRQTYQSVRKQNEKIIDERESRLKKVLTSEQYKKWTGVIEPSLHSRN